MIARILRRWKWEGEMLERQNSGVGEKVKGMV